MTPSYLGRQQRQQLLRTQQGSCLELHVSQHETSCDILNTMGQDLAGEQAYRNTDQQTAQLFFNNAQQRCVELSDEGKRLEEKGREAQRRLEDLETQLALEQSSCMDLQQNVETTSNELQATRTQLNKAELDAAYHRDRNVHLKDRMSLLASQRSSSAASAEQSATGEAFQGIEQLKKDVEGLRQESQHLKHLTVESKRAREALNSKRKRLMAQIAESHAAFQATCSDREAKLEEISSQLDAMKKLAEELEKRNEELRSERDVLVANADAMRESLENTQHHNMRRELEELETTIKSLESQNTALRGEHEAVVCELQQTQQALADTKHKQQAELHAMLVDLEQANRTIRGLKKENQELRAVEEKLLRDLDDAQQALETAARKHKGELEGALSQLHHMTNAQNALKEQNDQLQAMQNQLIRELDAKQIAVDEASAGHSSALSQLKDLSVSHNKLQQYAEDLCDKQQKLLRELDAVQADFHAAKQEHSAVLAQLDEMMIARKNAEDRNTIFAATEEKLLQELHDAEKALSVARDEHQMKLDAALAQISELELARNQLLSQNGELRRTHDDLRRRCDDTQKALCTDQQDHQREIKTRNSQLQTLEAALENLRRQNDALCTAQQTLLDDLQRAQDALKSSRQLQAAELERAISQLDAAHASSLEEFRRTKDDLTAQLEDIQHALTNIQTAHRAELQSQRDETQRALENAALEKEVLRRERDTFSDQSREVHRVLEDVRARHALEMSEACKELRAEVDYWKGRVELALDEITNLNQKLKEAACREEEQKALLQRLPEKEASKPTDIPSPHSVVVRCEDKTCQVDTVSGTRCRSGGDGLSLQIASAIHQRAPSDTYAMACSETSDQTSTITNSVASSSFASFLHTKLLQSKNQSDLLRQKPPADALAAIAVAGAEQQLRTRELTHSLSRPSTLSGLS